MILSSSSSTNSIAVIRRHCFCPTSKTSFSSFGNNKVSVYHNRYIQKQFHTSSTDASASDNTNAIHPSHMNVAGTSLQYKNLLVVIKQTAFEEYSQVRVRRCCNKSVVNSICLDTFVYKKIHVQIRMDTFSGSISCAFHCMHPFIIMNLHFSCSSLFNIP